MNSKKAGGVLGVALALFLVATMMHPVMAGVDAKITGVELNGQGDFIEVEPGELIGVEVFFEWKLIWSPQEALDEIVVGFEHTPIFCVVDEIINSVDEYDSSDIHNAIKAFEITAPTEPGTYCVYEMITGGDNACEEGKLKYKELYGTNVISSPYPIADFEVVDSGNDEPTPEPTPEPDSDEWERIYYKPVTLSPLGPVKRSYEILIWQNGNALRMMLFGSGVGSINDGSLSISVDEDVYIDYRTGDVCATLLAEDGYFPVNPNPSNEIGHALLSILAGFCAPISMAGNAVGLGTAIYNATSDYTFVDKHDPKEALRCCPSELFTSNYLNTRDVVVIPWDVDIVGVSTIRVDCPAMIYPEEGTHIVVFCLDTKLHWGRVCHYIALPIKIGKRTIEA